MNCRLRLSFCASGKTQKDQKIVLVESKFGHVNCPICRNSKAYSTNTFLPQQDRGEDMQVNSTARSRYSANEIQAWQNRKKLLDQVYQINIIDFARDNHITLEKGDSKTLHVPGSGGLYLFKNGKGYTWFTHPKPDFKRDIIGFAREYFGAHDVDEAIEMILGCRGLPTHTDTPREITKPKGQLVIPGRAPDNKRAFAYLVKTRGIDKEIVGEMMKQGRVFQSLEYKVNQIGEKKGPYQNICFVGFDELGVIRSGAMRSMSDKYRFRMDFTNNDKSYGFAMPGKSNRLYVFEAPIDAMSHATLFKLQSIDWRRDHRVSEGCLSDNALTRYLVQHPEIDEIIWCFDNDYDGVDDKGHPHNHGQIAADKYRKKYAGEYRTRIDTPIENDVNADLLVFRGWAKPAEKTTSPPIEEPKLVPQQLSMASKSQATSGWPAPTVPADRSGEGVLGQGGGEDEWDGFEP